MAKLTPRNPRGMRDFLPVEMHKREYVMGVIREVFESFGFEPIYTPVMELQETLLGNYGEDAEKLIYHAQHTKGSEDLALRYDLTVPLSRFFAQHENDLPLPFKRYHIAPVWRGERPGKGRFREFFQCDADIVGVKGPAADAECAAVVYMALTRLGFQDFTIKINNRKLLTGIGIYAGVPNEKLGDLYRSIDKTDKIGLDGVAKDLRGNGLADDVVERMVNLLGIQTDDKAQMLADLRAELGHIEVAAEALDDLDSLVQLLPAFGVSDAHTAFDFTMVRGLGYYTGIIYETVITKPENVGSVQGGGRYDELIGLFRSQSLPTTGISLGIERLIYLMDQLDLYPAALGKTAVQVLVTVFGMDTLPDAAKLASELREAGLRAETYLDDRKGLGKQFGFAESKGIPLAVILGTDEIAAGVAKVKDLVAREEYEVPRDQLAAKIQQLLS